MRSSNETRREADATATDTRVRTGLIGAGIGPSLSPALHEREGAAHGLDLTYTRFDLDVLGLGPDAVGDLLARARAQGYAGLNVTHPCKQRVIGHLDVLAPDAAAIGAVNTVVIGADGALTGHNTDWTGFRDGWRAGLPGAATGRVVLLGAGVPVPRPPTPWPARASASCRSSTSTVPGPPHSPRR